MSARHCGAPQAIGLPDTPCARCDHPHNYPTGQTCDYAVGPGECECDDYTPRPPGATPVRNTW